MSNVRWYAGWAVAVLALIALPIIVLATRGSSTTADPLAPEPSPSATPSPTAAPSAVPKASGTTPALDAVPLCSNVWQAGTMLPTDYRGCQRGGVVVKPQTDHCLVGYQGRWWAEPGQHVHRSRTTFAEDTVYAAALADC